MKKLFLLSSLLVVSLLALAQAPFQLTEGESAVLYALPKTEFCVVVQTEKVTRKPGVFYRYSERYLATNKVITEEKVAYRLKSVTVKTQALPDANRTYSVAPANNSALSRITVNAKGLLCGVNVSSIPEISLSQRSVAEPVLASVKSALLPLGEEYMMAGSEAKLAEGAAKQIYRIRESRLSLLTSDVEHVPADGVSFKAMLDGMNKMEAELTELFVGQTTTEVQTQNVFLIPDSAMTNQVLFRLSALRGLVAVDDLSGAPYYVSVVPAVVSTKVADPKSKKEKVGLYTILPASTQLSIGDGTNTYFSSNFFVPQFGKLVPLAESLFKQPRLKVYVDQQTGRLLRVE